MKTTANPIIEAEKNLIEAIRTNDAARLEKLLHDEILFVNQDGQIITKLMDMDAYLLARTTITELKATEQVITQVDDIVSVSVVIEVTGKHNDRVFKERQRFLRIWKNIGGNWKVIAGSCIRF